MFQRVARSAIAMAFAGLLACAAAYAATTPTSVTLQWTAPGDDGTTGTAAQYDVRWSTSPINESNFGAATRVNGAPAPLAAGSTQSMDITGLTPSTAYWFAIKTADDQGNWSAISNLVQWTTGASTDDVRPAPLAVTVGATTDNSVTLQWTAVGDDSLAGTATRYEVRWSTSQITGANWSGAVLVAAGVPTPAASGTAQSATVSGLDRSVDLWFAVRAYDEMNNASALSNVPKVDHVLDAAPPATPAGVVASVVAGGVQLNWNANSEPDLAGYHVYRAVVAGDWTRLTASPVASNSYLDSTAPDSATIWYAVTSVDAVGNESALSAGRTVYPNAANVFAVKLNPVYPNPSHMSDPVTLPVDVPAQGPYDGRVDILNGAGERVRTIALRGLTPGTNLVTWDGRNDSGRLIAPGVYRAWLQMGGSQGQVKLVRQP
ncbi:MAG: fibronectin type III domain-containing protein [Candidatus Eisenbacteria bacterium]